MKVIVFDKPNACWECMLCGRGVKERFCIARIYEQGNANDCDIKDVNKVESWCPLKPIPNYLPTPYLFRQMQIADGLQNEDGSVPVYTEDYQKGWNDCLDELLGETDDE